MIRYLSLLLIILISSQLPGKSQCNPDEVELTVTIISEEDASGTSWELKDDDNTIYKRVAVGTYENGLLYTTKICVPYHKSLIFSIMFNGGTYDGLFKVESDCNIFVSGTQFLDFHSSEFQIIKPDEEVEFDLVYGEMGNDYGLLGEQTCDGGYVVAGSVNRTGKGNDIFFQKISHYGDTLWTRYYGTDGSDYLYGLTKAPGENYIMLVSYGSFLQHLIKVDYVGNILWTKDLPVDPKKMNPYVRLFATREDTYVLVRYFQSLIEFSIIDGQGETVMSSYFGSGGRARFQATSIAQMDNGKLLILGTIWGVPLDGPAYEYPLVYVVEDANIIDYQEYNHKVKRIEEAFSISETEVYFLCEDSTKNTLMLTADFEGQVKDELAIPGIPRSMIRTSDNGFILCTEVAGEEATCSVIRKFDSELNMEWEKEIHKSGHNLVINSVRETMQGGYFFTGSMESQFSGLKDIYILKTNSGGEGCFYRPYGKEEICVVTIDLNTGKNLIVWEKTPGEGTQYYNIYREDKLIASQPYNDLSVYVDSEVDPETRAFLYKISVVDSCGNESGLSPYHKPIFLQYVSSVEGINLNWSTYEIEGGKPDFTGYDIYRGTTKNNVSEYVTDIPLEIARYTDTDPGALVTPWYYRVSGALKNACFPSGPTKKADSGPYSHAFSNVEDNRLQDTASSVRKNVIESLDIFPNPFSESTTISFINPGGHPYKLFILNISGQVCRIVENISSSEYNLLKGDLESGIYFLELRGTETYRCKLIVE